MSLWVMSACDAHRTVCRDDISHYVWTILVTNTELPLTSIFVWLEMHPHFYREELVIIPGMNN